MVGSNLMISNPLGKRPAGLCATEFPEKPQMNDYPPNSQFENHARLHQSDHYAAAIVARIVERYLAPTSVLELGCEEGVWLDVLGGDGRCHVQGVEEESLAPLDLAIDPTGIVNTSLARPLELKKTFDLVLCLNGPDHVESQYADVLIENCCRHGDTILFCTLLPGHSEPNRFNNICSESWTKSFRHKGYLHLDLVRPLISHDALIPLRYRQGLLLFIKDKSPLIPVLSTEAERVAHFSPLSGVRLFRDLFTPLGAEPDGRRLDEMAGPLMWQPDRLDRALADQLATREEARRLAAELERAVDDRQETELGAQGRAADLQVVGEALQASRDEVLDLTHDLERLRHHANTVQDERRAVETHKDELAAYVEALQARSGED